MQLSKPLRASLQRLRFTWPTILQLAATVTAAFTIAHFGLHHTSPALACTVALSSLSLNRDARPRRVAETAVAMVLGIALSATVVVALGRGSVQVAGTILVVLATGTLLSKNPAFALSAGTQSMLVAVLPDPVGGPYMRAVDGAIGGCCALLATAILPAAPMRRALSVGETSIREVAAESRRIARSLLEGDPSPAQSALRRLRLTQTRIEAWGTLLESAQAIARFSPVSRRTRESWLVRGDIQIGVSHAASDLRMVARRAAVISRTGRPQPVTASTLLAIGEAFESLVGRYQHPNSPPADSPFHHIAVTLGDLASRTSVDPGIIAMLRQVVVDGLLASGLSEDQARGVLPPPSLPLMTAPTRIAPTDESS